jgi:HEAT repeat protein/nucleoside phosphorylase
MCSSEHYDCRVAAVDALASVFSQIRDKSQAWQDLHGLTQDKDPCIRLRATSVLVKVLGQVPDKSQALQDIIRLTRDEDIEVRRVAVDALGSALNFVPDKSQIWQDLVWLTQDRNREVRRVAVDALGSTFNSVPDKFQAWQDLHELTQDEDDFIRWRATHALVLVSGQVPDKSQAWQDLVRLTQDRDADVRGSAADALESVFGSVPDKSQAWQDLVRLTQHMDRNVRRRAALVMVSAFNSVPDKSQVWQDLLRLTQDEDSDVRGRAAFALGWTFSSVPDKSQAWQDLVRLTQHMDRNVRGRAAFALVSAFGCSPDKSQVWQDVLGLTQDEDSDVRGRAAFALGSAFSSVPDKSQIWEVLIRLSEDENRYVRMHACYALGRASVFKAVESDDIDTMKKELEAAITNFEKSSQESLFSPARFCGPFYHSYYAIVFQKAKEDVVQSYLAEAKRKIDGSEGKDELIKAIENLAQALQETERLKGRSLEEIASELNAYRLFCEKACEHMAAAEDKAPRAVKLMKKFNPFLEEQIQATIAEIQKNAKQICQIARGSGTEYEAPITEIYKAAEVLLSGDLVDRKTSSSIIVFQLMKLCEVLPNDERGLVCKVVKEIDLVSEFPEKIQKIELALSNLTPVLLNILKYRKCLEDVVILTVLPEEYNAILTQLSGFSPLELPSNMDSNPNIYAWKSGRIPCRKQNGTYKVAVGMIGRAGNSQSALAAKEAISLWRPHYLIFSGVAGGLPSSDLKKGDVIIADCIYGYEYGKLEGVFKTRENLVISILGMIQRLLGKTEKIFEPRGKWTYKTDPGLLNGAVAYSCQGNWRYNIRSEPPEGCRSEVSSGEIASGEKVVDDPTNAFFSQVIKMWPKVRAVEMEGAGIGGAIEQAQSLKIPVGFMVIRAISDLPRHEGDGDKTRGTEERDAWKTYASDTAAAFVAGWIADGLPLPPSD